MRLKGLILALALLVLATAPAAMATGGDPEGTPEDRYRWRFCAAAPGHEECHQVSTLWTIPGYEGMSDTAYRGDVLLRAGSDSACASPGARARADVGLYELIVLGNGLPSATANLDSDEGHRATGACPPPAPSPDADALARAARTDAEASTGGHAQPLPDLTAPDVAVETPSTHAPAAPHAGAPDSTSALPHSHAQLMIPATTAPHDADETSARVAQPASQTRLAWDADPAPAASAPGGARAHAPTSLQATHATDGVIDTHVAQDLSSASRALATPAGTDALVLGAPPAASPTHALARETGHARVAPAVRAQTGATTDEAHAPVHPQARTTQNAQSLATPLRASASPLTLALALALGAALASLVLGALGLYHRVGSAQAGEHPARSRILARAAQEPGITFTRLAGEMNLSRKTIAYHVRVLERSAAVRVLQVGPARLVFPSGVDPRTRDAQLALRAPLARALVARLATDSRPAPIVELARELGVTPQAARAQASKLTDAGLARVELAHDRQCLVATDAGRALHLAN